ILCLNIFFNGHNSPTLNSPQKLLNDLAEIKRVNKSDLKAFLTQDHTSFTVLSVSTKHIESTNRISVTLSKNSAQSFYLDQTKTKISTPPTISNLSKPDDCLQDAQNCVYFQFFNSKEKKLYTRFKDNFEANFLCACLPSECSHQHLFLTGTYNTSQQDHYARSLNKRAAGQYLAKYLSKSFHLRTLYAQHGLKDRHRAYHFYLNLYDYEQRAVNLVGKSKIDQITGTNLNGNQHIFRHYDYQTAETSYFYRTNKKLTGQCSKPVLIKKNYRLGTRALNPLNLLTLATKHSKKELYQFKKPKKPMVQHDFQEFLITRLLLLCSKAEFTHLPLEQERVSKEQGTCDQLPYTHFQTKPVLHFQFLPENATV
ncbi:1944_t:CDS:2, partial [Funneliformis geosporum]